MAAINNVFGGAIKIHYWLLPISRGNNLRLLCADLGIPFEDVATGEIGPSWLAQYKKETLEAKINLGTVPYVTLPDGRILGEHTAAMRYIARKAGSDRYPVEDQEKCYVVDEMLDLNQDWRVARRNAEYYTDANRLLILTTLEHKYASNPFHGSGPYLLGEKISIADYFTFQTLNELPVAIRTEEEEQKFPELMKVWKAVAQRPGIKALLEEQKEGVEKLKVFLGLAGK